MISLHFLGIIFVLPAVLCADWWENGNFYQIYPRSFMDSDGDGIGDLNGIASKLDYLKEIGITGTWLSPIFKSPMKDFGYDTEDYREIQPEYGTMADFENLVKRCKELDIKLILDFVPNHTSDLHDWFIRSENGEAEYKDYYIWHPGKIENGVRVPPNNWVSIFRFSAWQWSEKRQEYYLHQFVKEQPDLNYRNPKVVQAMKDVLVFWMEKGVSGFRVDAVPFLFEVEADADGNYPDEPLSGECDDPDSTCYLSHIYTQNIDDTFDMAYQWREVLDKFTSENDGVETKIMMTESYTSLENEIRFYTDGTVNGSQIPFNFELISYINNESTAKDYKFRIDSWLKNMPVGYQANWVMGNHDNKRLASRFGVARTDLMNMLLQTLPGVAVTYNGEELGMTDVYIPWEQTVDPAACNTNETVFHTYSRDPARTPFQWDDSVSAGFSTNETTWLPVATDYKTNNVKQQKSAPFSHLKIFKKLTKVRRTQTFTDGDLNMVAIDDDVLVYERRLSGHDTYVILLNFSTNNKVVDLTKVFPDLPARLEIITSSLRTPASYVAG
ncbi:hypothetical protein HA402_007284 [Bradysia odoriphaga]|nr:hypothetical protein HA402_007284 [Bradysia odoriphaga]